MTSFEEVDHALRARIENHRRTGDRNEITADTAEDLAARLAGAAPSTADAHLRFSTTLGWFHLARFALDPTEANYLELVRSVYFFEQVAQDTARLPDALKNLVGPSAKPDTQAEFATGLMRYALATTEPVVLDLGTRLLDTALAATPVKHRHRASRLSTCGIAHRLVFERTGDTAHLDKALALGEAAVEATSRRDADWPLHLSNLGTSHLISHKYRAGADDLDNAVEAFRRAADAIPTEKPEHAVMLPNLSSAYYERFLRSGHRNDLDQAILHGRTAVDRLPAGDDRIRALAILANSLRQRFRHDGDSRALDDAIGFGREVLTGLREDQPEYRIVLANLGGCLQNRFTITGDPADLDDGIEASEAALVLTPVGAVDRAVVLTNLCAGYESRFTRSGVRADLDRAIELGEDAVESSPVDNRERAERMSNLADCYRTRFERAGAGDDLDRAIDLAERAVAIGADDQPGRAGMLSNLGASYFIRFGARRRPADLERSIELGAAAIACAPAGHPDRVNYLSNLGSALQSRFESAGTIDSAVEAVTLFRQALALAPVDHPRRATLVSNLGTTYLSLLAAGEKAPGQNDWKELVGHTRSLSTSSPSTQVKARYVVGQLAQRLGDLPVAVECFDNAIAMLPAVPPRESTWIDQEFTLAEHDGLISEAIAAHCAAADPAGALLAAEHGKAILLAAALDSRTDLTDLEERAPDLAARFRSTREHLDHEPTAGGAASIDLAQSIRARKKLWASYHELVREIRTRPGLASFLSPPTMSALLPAVASGPAILVNAAQHRSDAVIVDQRGEIRHVPLPCLTRRDLTTHLTDVLDITHLHSIRNTLRSGRVTRAMLGWLWDAAVEPIVDAIDQPTGPGAPAPHVWWMPSGLLGLLPLHAAGHPSRPGALDAVVSSYTPTLRILAHAGSRPRPAERRQLVVALEHTPDLPDLPGTVEEAKAIRPDDAHRLLDREATVDTVKHAIVSATWAHFACHARLDGTSSSRGGLCLADGVLPLAEITKLDLHEAELAYLSACQTAAAGWRHPDEALHLASAFQLAGFRHVIASFWPLRDHLAATAAADFYTTLAKYTESDHDGASRTLNRVSKALRERHPDDPHLWAPLMHCGA
ncbi:CHAT domain-containing tetratricopeptide repeat protein [Amycolatopsis tolypomycina]|uniref:CHAT domain-containing tetratricopeptide repeat protein n=1 Tax=Amycolatopsis tolypomycina TaxID=208445 RepID=UPI0033B90DC4